MRKEVLSKETLFLCIACVLSNVSYYPALVSSGMGRIFAIAIWIFLAITLLFRGVCFASSSFFHAHLLLYFIVTLNTVITSVVNDVNAFYNHFFPVVTISTIILIVAIRYGLNFKTVDLKRICVSYYITTSIMAILLFAFYLRGSDLSSSVYGYVFGKNEIAVMLVSSLIIGSILYEPDNRLKRVFKIVSILFLLTDILYLRCRSSFLGVIFLLGTLSIYSNRMTQKLRITVILGLFAVTVYFFANPDSFDTFLNQIVYAGRDASDISDLSSGRDVEVSMGLKLFRNSPLFGLGRMSTVDCFYVSALANYGLLAWPLIAMALLPVIWACTNLKKGKKEDLCFFILAFSMFFISLFEEQAPFGPGSRCYILWLMWGILLQINSRESIVQIITKK
ncbi:hypothetical protein B7990_11920 [Fibrobacter sp. UWB4]|uniref:hypothetical protein n=1 Tax=Fibrobacter sp. UWB4 TaxID=1964356 RepID=UPI000B51E65F|nr:hypothetical protein [Fibrobacter sp. UWB4]OWV16439.1 hypothetical protein B7990_11920 [Fibrobacter sp. UWB4]